jgi:uroporphyrinogen III methyltransferase/synthase
MPHQFDSVQSPLQPIRPPGRTGKVYLVGAGPGEPGLLTVRGRECLNRADFVLYDGLADDRLLAWASQAQCISVGKHGESPIWTQADINAKLLELAAQGQVVVRLKGGDPAVFARTAEELEVLAAANVPFEVVPGITAALAAASYVGIPITHRQHASAVAFVTGQQQSSGAPTSIDWSAVATFPGTIVFYMGVTTAETWTSELLTAGKPADTPAAIVRRCTWADQSVIRCRLDEVASQLTPASRMRPPVIVIVGAVAELGKDFDWFSSRPLRGCGVLVTRPEHQATEMLMQLNDLGAETFIQPMLEITRPTDLTSLDQAVDSLRAGNVQGITFSSPNGVDGVFTRLKELELDCRLLAGVCVACVGPATSQQLEKYGVRADVAPHASEEFSARGLLEALDKRARQQGANVVQGQTWIVTNTDRSRDTLRLGLQERGAQVIVARAYDSLPATKLHTGIQRAIEAGRINYITITSSTIADTAFTLLEGYRSQVVPISLAPSLSQHLTKLGWPAVIEAPVNTTSAIIDELVSYWNNHKPF